MLLALIAALIVVVVAALKIFPSNSFLDNMQTAIEQFPVDYYSDEPLTVKLAQNAFTESADAVIGDFTECDFTGYGDLSPATNPMVGGLQPGTLRRVVKLVEPVGGYNWTCSGTANLPQTVYGFYVVDTSGLIVVGCKRFTTPIVIANGVTFGLTPDDITFLFAAMPVS